MNLDFDNLKGLEIIHLLNQINWATNEGYWSLYGNEIELRYATHMNKSLSKKYFIRMIKRTISTGNMFYPLILKQIRCDKNPYDLVHECFFKNNELKMIS